MKVTVNTNSRSKNNKRMIEITFSKRPNSEFLNELKRKGWWWNGKSWSHFYSRQNKEYAMSLSRIFNKSNNVNYIPQKMYINVDDYEAAFSNLRIKRPMKKKHDYGTSTSSEVRMTSSYDCRSRMVSSIS